MVNSVASYRLRDYICRGFDLSCLILCDWYCTWFIWFIGFPRLVCFVWLDCGYCFVFVLRWFVLICVLFYCVCLFVKVADLVLVVCYCDVCVLRLLVRFCLRYGFGGVIVYCHLWFTVLFYWFV